MVQERKNWNRDHPHGFFARPQKNPDGTRNLMSWVAGIPGKKGTPWEGGIYKLRITFPEDYPAKPPLCKFDPVIFHPNIYPSGTVCLNLLNAPPKGGWTPSLNLKAILIAIQELLDTPNELDPAQRAPFELYCRDKAAYAAKVREEARRYTPS